MNLLLDLGRAVQGVGSPVVYTLLVMNVVAFLAYRALRPTWTKRDIEVVLVVGSVAATATSAYLALLMA